MPELSAAELAEATGGVLMRGSPETKVSSFALDTRRMKPGGAFFALKGTRADGHGFLGHAARAGAGLAVVHEEIGEDHEAPPTLVRVEDTTRALGECGAYVRKRLRGVKLIAVTGSSGKTTTKELIAAGLGSRSRVHRSPGNFNNHLGVPLSLLACPDDAEVIVQEMGMSGAGEIAHLTRMADPDVALVTNVAPAHLEAFRDLDELAASKGELFAFLSGEGTSVVNLDDPQVRVQAARHDGPRVTFGRNASSDLRLEHVENRFLPGAGLDFRFAERRHRLRLRLGGAHSAFNALSALAAIHASGDDLEPAMKAMEQVEAGPGRGRILRLGGDILLVDETYNSNPLALASVLETLKNTSVRGRKILVLGDMLELGPQGKTFHHEAGRKAAAAGVAVLVGVGPLSRTALESGRRSGIPEIHHENEAQQVPRYLSGRLRRGDLVVVKGSRGIGLERVVDTLLRERGRSD